MHVRSAALRVLGACPGEEALSIASLALDSLPAASEQRECLLRALAAVVRGHAGTSRVPAFRHVMLSLLAATGAEGVSEDTRIVVARAVRYVLGAREWATHPSFWIERLSSATTTALPSPYAPATGRPRFGVPGTGTRVAFVLDLSSSMQRELSEDEQRLWSNSSDPEPMSWAPGTVRVTASTNPKEPSGAVTGGRAQDIAIAQLLESLRALPAGAEFFVVVFGTRARLLSATRGFVRPSPPVLRAVREDLEEMSRGPSAKLGDTTNLHAALMLALQGEDRPLATQDYYGGAIPRGRAPHAVFVLSDGHASCDSWGGELKGPVRDEFNPSFLRDDVVREDLLASNLFRSCEVNCLVFSGANEALLTSLAGSAEGRALCRPDRGPGGLLPSSQPAPRLVEYLRSVLRDTAQEASERAGSAIALGAALGKGAVPDLLWALSSPSDVVRAGADSALVAIGGRGFRYFPGMQEWESRSLAFNWNSWAMAQDK